MAVTGISFFYEEEKANILKQDAKADDRTTSSYIQRVLQDHIDSVERKIPRKTKIIKKRGIKND